jgi:hypothetical protein
MALIAKAWIYAMSTEPQATALARRMVEELAACRADPAKRAIMHALKPLR